MSVKSDSPGFYLLAVASFPWLQIGNQIIAAVELNMCTCVSMSHTYSVLGKCLSLLDLLPLVKKPWQLTEILKNSSVRNCLRLRQVIRVKKNLDPGEAADSCAAMFAARKPAGTAQWFSESLC